MTGLEPVNLFLTKEVLYLLSYMGKAFLKADILAFRPGQKGILLFYNIFNKKARHL